MSGFTLVEVKPLELVRPDSIAGMYVLSPFVWPVDQGYNLLVRLVNHADDPVDKVSRIHHGRSRDGRRFTLDASPVLAPGPGPEDSHGCEDPTAIVVGERTYVYYSGWNRAQEQGQLLLATGRDALNLTKHGVVLASSQTEANPKETSVARVDDGSWRLFFEYSDGQASLIGAASAPAVDGPWTVTAPPFAPR